MARRKRGVRPLTRKVEFFQNHNGQIPEFLKRVGALGVARSSAQAGSGRRSLTVLETKRPRPDIHPPSHFVVRRPGAAGAMTSRNWEYHACPRRSRDAGVCPRSPRGRNAGSAGPTLRSCGSSRGASGFRTAWCARPRSPVGYENQQAPSPGTRGAAMSLAFGNYEDIVCNGFPRFLRKASTVLE